MSLIKIASLLFLSFLVSCIQIGGQRPSRPLVFNGLDDEIAREHIEVVKLTASEQGSLWSCSGTFISPKILVTSARCLSNPSNGKAAEKIEILAEDGKRYSGIGYRWSLWTNGNQSSVSRDLALVKFEQDVVKKFAKIAPADKVFSELEVIMVGFGVDKKGASAEKGIRRSGITWIKSSKRNIIYTHGISKRSEVLMGGMAVSATSGDTGGAIFNKNGELLGVISGDQAIEEELTAYKSTAISSSTLINHVDSADFFREASSFICKD